MSTEIHLEDGKVLCRTEKLLSLPVGAIIDLDEPSGDHLLTAKGKAEVLTVESKIKILSTATGYVGIPTIIMTIKLLE